MIRLALRSRWTPFASLLLLSLSLLGCEEDVAAVLPVGYPYTLYAVLNPTADTQFVRVYPVEATLELAGGERLDAVVTSTNLETGVATTWNDSLVQLPNGDYGYLYWTTARLDEGQRVRLSAGRSDGAASYAEVTVPSVPSLLPLPVVVDAQNIHVEWPIRMGGHFPKMRYFEVDYAVSHGCQQHPEHHTTVSYLGRLEETPGGWIIPLDIDQDRARIIKDLIDQQKSYTPAFGLRLTGLTIRSTVTDLGWEAPGGAFDPELLIEPGLMSNVNSGFGFVGAGYVFDEDVRVTDEVRQDVGMNAFPVGGCPPGTKG